jgi:hypothetical protein
METTAADRRRTRGRAAPPRWVRAVRLPAVWHVYAALLIAGVAFLAVVLLMALGVVGA